MEAKTHTATKATPDAAGLIRVARGLEPAELLLKNARLIDTFTGEAVPTDVAIHAGLVAGLGDYKARETIDLEGRWLCPGFIDGHIHIESTMLTPPEFARAVAPHGTAAVVIDPHEIANVRGIAGIEYMLAASEDLPVAFFVMLPSCVPATEMESSGARLEAADLKPLLTRERVLGIAEMMNYPGVLAGDPEVLAKIAIAGGRPVDGHAPALTGGDLNAYIGAGIGSDHECVTAAEAKEKLRLGMRVMVRCGGTESSLEELAAIITPENSRRMMLVTDDRPPAELLGAGHTDYLLRRAIAAGVPPATAVQMLTLNTAEYFGLAGYGAVAPGYRADLVVLDDLKQARVSVVFREGQPVALDGQALSFTAPRPPAAVYESVHVDEASLADLAVPVQGEKIKVIGILPGQLETEKLLVTPKVEGTLAVSDPDRDILKLVVAERHRASGRRGIGFVRGVGLKRGAIASSVAHDSHNIVAVGVTDEEIRLAIAEVIRLQGGAAVVDGGRVTASLPLPVAGLMSDRPAAEVAALATALVAAARELGCTMPDPLISLSFLALPVIPELKLTDRGLVDVGEFKIVDLFE